MDNGSLSRAYGANDEGPTSSSDSASSRQPYPRFWKAYDSPDEPWQVRLVVRLARLSQLAANWDGFGAKPIRPDASMFALTVLRSIMRPRSPSPQVVPISDGGLQLEWHVKSIDLEIRISAPYEFELWFEDKLTGFSICKELGADLTDLKRPLELLTDR
jgi:hypothetical protein